MDIGCFTIADAGLAKSAKEVKTTWDIDEYLNALEFLEIKADLEWYYSEGPGKRKTR